MTERYFPFDDGPGKNIMESDWSLMAKNWLGTGVIPSRLNELQVYADSTGMQSKIKTGQAFMEGHFYQNDAEVVLAHSAAHATLPRIDRIILRIDWTANTIGLAVLPGTASGAPTAPALTQLTGVKWEISLAQVRVDAAVGTIAANKVTDERPWAEPKLKNGRAVGDANRLRVTQVYMTDGQGYFNVNFGKTLVNPIVVLCNGDSNLGNILIMLTGSTGDGFTARALFANTNAVVANTSIRVNWMAEGDPA